MQFDWSAMLTVAINAGGLSHRMGENKALKIFAGQPMVVRMVERLRPIADELLVTTNQPEDFQFLGLPLVSDRYPGYGALSGLFTAIEAAHHPLVAVVACDMPFINARLLAVQLDIIESEGVDAVVPMTPDGLEPLHAIYRRATCLPVIYNAIHTGKRRLIDWFPLVTVHRMATEEVAQVDPDFHSFINVNTPEEFRRAELLDSHACQ